MVKEGTRVAAEISKDFRIHQNDGSTSFFLTDATSIVWSIHEDQGRRPKWNKESIVFNGGLHVEGKLRR